MGKSVWTVGVFGVLCCALLAMAMCMSLEDLKRAPAIKLSDALRGRFRFPRVRVDVWREGDRKVLAIEYHAAAAGEAERADAGREIQEVADFAASKYEGKDRKEISTVKVTRLKPLDRGTDVQRGTFPFAPPAPR
jgi:hypothetical protein